MINKENTLVIISSKKTSYGAKLYNGIRNKGYEVAESVHSVSNIFLRAFRKISMITLFPTWQLVSKDWANRVEGKENIIIIHDMYSFPIIRILRDKFKYKGNVILYYMDPVASAQAKDCYAVDYNAEKHRYAFDIYSFEIDDCKKYGFNYNSLFFFKEDITGQETTMEQDVFFIGKDKGRLEDCIRIKKELEKYGLTVAMHICPVKGKPSEYGKKIGFSYSKEIPYDELIRNIKRSKAILEIAPINQKALTLRVYEALANHIKVITNNKNIRSYSFYNSKNIFILDNDDHKKLKDFIDSQFDESNNKEIEDMEFENWIRRF